MSSCIGSKEELVAKQLLNGAMVTMNHDTTDCMGGNKKFKFKNDLNLHVSSFALSELDLNLARH